MFKLLVKREWWLPLKRETHILQPCMDGETACSAGYANNLKLKANIHSNLLPSQERNKSDVYKTTCSLIQ